MYPIPQDEAERLNQLWQYRIVNTHPEDQFDRIAELAATLFSVPIATISFVDAERLWLKARVGLNACEAPRDIGFCAHTIMQDMPMIVPDMLEDERFAANPLVQNEPGIRFYAGVPLKVAGGFRLGRGLKPRPVPC